MWVPDEHRLRKIRMDVKRMKELGVDPVRVAGWLTDFLIKVQLGRLKKEHPSNSYDELVKILRRNLSERDRDEL